MKELGITKGEWRFIQEEMKIKGSGDIEGLTVIANVSPKMDYSRGMTTQCNNAKLIADAGTTANKCGMLPSELLELYNEAIEVLKEVHKDGDNYLPRTIRIKVEQTISKANRE